jgi:hypothetical protein
VEPVRHVGVERTEADHLTNFWRNAEEVVAYEGKALDLLELPDARREGDDLFPGSGIKFFVWRELFTSIGDRHLDQRTKAAPSLTLRVLWFEVKLARRGFRAVEIA